MKTFVIKDWAGNVLKQKTKSGLWVEMEFKSFDDAVDHLHAKFSYIEDENKYNDQIDEFYVDEQIGPIKAERYLDPKDIRGVS